MDDIGRQWFFAKRTYTGKQLLNYLDDIDENHNQPLASLENTPLKGLKSEHFDPITAGVTTKSSPSVKYSAKRTEKKISAKKSEKESPVQGGIISPTCVKRHTYSSRHVADIFMSDEDQPTQTATPRSARKSLNMLHADDLKQKSSIKKNKGEIDSPSTRFKGNGWVPGQINSPCSPLTMSKSRNSKLKTIIYTADIDDAYTLQVIDNG